MKKFLILTTAALVAAVAAEAREVSAARAREIAAQVLPQMALEPVRNASAPSVTASEPYYIFNAARSAGYVIVAGDDRLPAVLGYSLTGHLEADRLPDGLLALLRMSQAALEADDEASAAPAVTAGTPVMEPLLGDINWGQDSPFNTLCPMVSNQRTYVGCVATAMAQIMRYYSYPSQGTGSHSYTQSGTTLSADFGATTYDWANMPAVVPDAPTEAQTSAYSTLSYHLGVAVNMTYATGGSGAYTMDVPGALRDHFGYTRSLRMHSRNYYNTDEWMQMIRTELDAGRPVYYSASSEDGMGGHAFVCDGYDSEGYVHMNWGWYGSSNGYFYINHLNPGELGTGGGSGAYNVDQEIITHFMPAVIGDSPLPTLYGDTRFTCDSYNSGMTMLTYLGNLDTDPFEGDMIAVLLDADGKIVKELKSQQVTVNPFKNGVSGSLYFTMRDIPVTVGADVPNGSYRLKLAYRTAAMDAPELLRHPIGLPCYGNCMVLNGQILLTEKHQPAPKVTMSTELAPDGEIYASGSARFLVSLNNESEDFRLSTVVLTMESVTEPSVSCSKEYYVNVYELSSADLTMAIDLPDEIVPGKYKVTLAHKNHADKPFATHDGKETIVEVLPALSNPVIRFTTSPVWQSAAQETTGTFARGDLIYIAAQAKNYAAEGETMVICRLVNEHGAAAVLRADSHSWKKGEQRTLTISNYVNVDPGTYSLSFSYLDAKGAEQPINVADLPASIIVTESDATPIEVTACNIPTAIAQGEKVACSITLKALNDVRGRFYVRVRQFTATKGEIVYANYSLNLTAGQEKTFNFSYRPGVDDGMYMTMAEVQETGSSNYIPAAGHANYYKEIAIGETAALSDVAADSLVADGPEEWFTLQGVKIARPTIPGIYIRRQGGKAAKIAVN
ncbi:MAG: C10 family peptidase [Candidatus Amulumruptor caecigallinarius]|nr:C10 family peptidase [Candidatus Amulumruptor caecigallinarius]MCM1396598.1 C10 family peptidase [Candidatus Amulumruptor caecigallinarius]MCM1453344.1 C10 family peptidase [bacterium]